MLSKTSRVISSKARQPLGRRPKGKAISQSALVRRDSSGKLRVNIDEIFSVVGQLIYYLLKKNEKKRY